MTHDELLAELDELNTMKMWSGDSPMYRKDKALRAVVELHKPDVSWFDKTEPVCGHDVGSTW